MHLYPTNCHCFSCGANMDIFDFVAKWEGLDRFNDKLDFLCKRYGIDYDPFYRDPNHKVEIRVLAPELTNEQLEFLGLMPNPKGVNFAPIGMSMQRQYPGYREDDFSNKPPMDCTEVQYLVGEWTRMNIKKLRLEDEEAYVFLVMNKARETQKRYQECYFKGKEALLAATDKSFLIGLLEYWRSKANEAFEIYMKFREYHIRKNAA